MNHVPMRRLSRAFWILLLFFNFGYLCAQTSTVSVNFENASPAEIIKNLESRTPYRFVYPEGLDLSNPKITMKKENVSIDEVIKELQAKTDLNFRRTENSIAINKKQAAKKQGKLTGKVVDAAGLSLPGASVLIIGTNLSAVADADGNYSLSVEPGTYIIEVSFISYHTQNITGVKISQNDITKLNVALTEDAQSLNEVVITQTYQKATASTEGMLLEQKKAAQMSDGISAEQISRTPDRDVGATLKRITGVTTVDDRYVVVRSMGERWNQAVLDGVNLPSTDPSQQQFNFEIVPTSMVESVVVSKNATPDMYANFAGGHVEVRTRAIPKEDFNSITVGSSFNSRSTFEDRLTKQMGRYDYLGFDDGSRDFPKGLVNIQRPVTEAQAGPFLEQSKRFTQDNFTTYKTNTAPGSSLQISVGRAYELNETARWGFVGALVFRNTQEQLQIEHTERGTWMSNVEYQAAGEQKYGEFRQYGFKNSGASYSYNSTLGGMFNAGFQFNNHKITARNIIMHLYDNTLTSITGWNQFGGAGLQGVLNGTYLPYTTETNYPVYQMFLQNKIEGEHQFGRFDINWFAAFGMTSKDTKDATFNTKNRIKVGEDELLFQEIYNSAPNNYNRANYTNDETNYNVGVNFKYDFNFNEAFQNTIKGGYFGTYKKATNQQDNASMVTVGQPDRALVYIPDAQLLDGSYYGWGGFGWQRATTYGNKYIGDVKVHSPFLMLDTKFSNVIRLVWGMRAESYVYTQISSQADNPQSFDTEQRDEATWQYLPSANLTVSPTAKTNIRAGYNKSVLRPQFAERLNMPYFDPLRGAQVLNYTGGIISTIVDNYDIKAEWFPTRGEVISLGVYRKNLKNPIEGVTDIANEGGTRTIFNMNSYSARLYGLELEMYKNLSFLGEGDALNRIYFYANAAFNNTRVTGYTRIDGTGGLYTANRPMYGQSPYNYNLGFDYLGERFGFSVRHNATGDQYLLVGFKYEAEEIRMPYAVTDLLVSYKFLKGNNLELRFGVKNLFDSPIKTYDNYISYLKPNENYNGNVQNIRERYQLTDGATDKYDEGLDRIRFQAWNGRTLNFSINYSFTGTRGRDDLPK